MKKNLKDGLYNIDNILSDAILQSNKTQNITEQISKENINHILTKLFQIGQFELLITITKKNKNSKEAIDFINNHQLYLFSYFYDHFPIEIKSFLNGKPDLKHKDKSDDEIRTALSTISPERELYEYIKLFSEALSRSNKNSDWNEFLSVQKNYPLISNFYLNFLKKTDYNKYLSILMSNHDTLSSLLFENYINKKDKKKISINKDLLNKIFRDYDKESWLSIFNQFDTNQQDELILKRTLLESYNFKNKLDGDYPFAICISGQFRGGTDCIDFWINFSKKWNAPIFLSTWDKIGTAHGSHGDKGQRLIPNEFKSYFRAVSTKEITDLIPESKALFKGKTKIALESIIGNQKNSNLLVKINSEENFKTHNKNTNIINQIKMFHNINIVIDMMKRYEIERNVRFKNIIWARPDLKVIEFNPNIIEENKVLTSFIGNGSSCGDLIIQTNRNNIDFMYDLDKVIYNNNIYFEGVGPRLLGDSALFNGIYIEKFKHEDLKHAGLISPIINKDTLYKKTIEYNGKNKNILDLKIVFTIENLLKNKKIEAAIELYKSQNLVSQYLCDKFRDYAIAYENESIKIAHDLMNIAYEIRPQGPLIASKLKYYREELEHAKKTNN